jgi:hypothetical protein
MDIGTFEKTHFSIHGAYEIWKTTRRMFGIINVADFLKDFFLTGCRYLTGRVDEN